MVEFVIGWLLLTNIPILFFHYSQITTIFLKAFIVELILNILDCVNLDLLTCEFDDNDAHLIRDNLAP